MNPLVKRILPGALFLGLLLLGGWSLLGYLSVPVHQQVLLSDADRSAVSVVCPTGGVFCPGMNAIVPFLGQTLRWAAPFLWYGVLSALLFAGLVLWQYVVTGTWTLQVVWKPWKIVALFLGSIFLLFHVLALGYDGEAPMRRLVEPLPQVYKSITEDQLRALQGNFQDLKARVCLHFVGQSVTGAQVYDESLLCIEGGFITRVLPPFLLVALFLGELLVLGSVVLSFFHVRQRHPLAEFMVSIGVGASVLIAILWVLALLSLYTQTVGWLLLIAIPLVGYRQVILWSRRFLVAEWRGSYVWYSVTLLLGWLLLSYLAFNFITVIRPFPIGWDDLGRYINQPRQLVSYGHFIPQMATFQWEYLTSLGFLLLGYSSVPGATFAMMINWSAGMLAALSVYAFGLVFFGRKRGLLAAVLYYTLPLVGHFSFADMKIDNAVFTMGTLATLCFFLALFPTYRELETEDGHPVDVGPQHNWKYMALAGVFSGMAFAMKPTAVMVVMGLATILFGIIINTWAFFGTAFLGWAFYTWHTEFNPAAISQYVYGASDVISKNLVYAVCIGLGVLLLVVGAVRRRGRFLLALRMIGVFVAGIFAAMLPWLTYNNIQQGHFPPILELGATDTISPVFAIEPPLTSPAPGQDVRVLPPELRPDLTNAACKNTSKQEEVDRYWGGGKGKGWGHYLTLPWRSVMNIDSAGYYVTTVPALLLFPLLFLLPMLRSRARHPLRWLAIATLFQILQWVFFANGIPWYGVGMFLGLALGLEALVFDAPGRSTKWLAGVFVALSIIIALDMRFWQFDQQRNLLEYPMGKVSAEAIRKRTIPHYDDISATILQRHQSMPDRPYVYRIGTFIPYFIPRSMENLPMTDNQLDFFNCLNQERDAALTLKRLKALGFSSIIFDTNTQTIEQNPNGTLHKKVAAFLAFVNTQELGLQIAIDDVDGGVAYVLIP